MPTDWNEKNEEFVRWLQQALGIDADGKAGSGTKEAVRAALDLSEEKPAEAPEGDIPRVVVPGYKQFLPPYKEAHIGNAPALDTIGQSGCGVCALSDLISIVGTVDDDLDIDPLNISVLINQKNGFTDESLLRWERVCDVLGDVCGGEWEYHKVPYELNRCVGLLAEGVYPIIRVKRGHFVVAIGYEDGKVIIADPGTGDHHEGSDTLEGPPKNYRPTQLRILRQVA